METKMRVLGKLALAVVAGGVGLGSILGAVANPVMKQPPEQPWRNALQAPVAADGDYLVIEDAPEDLTPYPDRYAPTWAREELAETEPVYPAWTYSDPVDERLEDASGAAEPVSGSQPALAVAEPAAPPEAAPQPVAAEPSAHDPTVAVNLAALY